MKYFIISDIHSNLEALTSVLEEVDKEKPDIKVCLGDIVGYGPDPDECTDLIFSTFDIIIAGNHDQAVTGEYSTQTFNPLARIAVEWSQTHMKNSNIIKLKSLEAEAVRQQLLSKYDTGIIAIGKIIRVAFSSTPTEQLAELFENIYNACRDLR